MYQILKWKQWNHIHYKFIKCSNTWNCWWSTSWTITKIWRNHQLSFFSLAHPIRKFDRKNETTIYFELFLCQFKKWTLRNDRKEKKNLKLYLFSCSKKVRYTVPQLSVLINAQVYMDNRKTQIIRKRSNTQKRVYIWRL